MLQFSFFSLPQWMQHLSVVTLLSFSFSRRESQLFREKKLCTLFSCKESPLFFLKVTFHSFLVKNLHFPRHCPLCWPLLCQLLKQAILEATQSAGNGHAHRQQEHFNLFYISFQHFLNFFFLLHFPFKFSIFRGKPVSWNRSGLEDNKILAEFFTQASQEYFVFEPVRYAASYEYSWFHN